MRWVNWLYVIFVGIILAITTGFGVAAFYPEPIGPQYPYTTPIPKNCFETPEAQKSAACQRLTDEDQQKQLVYQKQVEEHRNKTAGYTRTAVFLGVAVGAVYALLGLVMLRSSQLVANGLLLAGVLTAVLTRLLVSLASLGAPTTAYSSANQLAFVEFGVLVVLSVAVIVVGLKSLKNLT